MLLWVAQSFADAGLDALTLSWCCAVKYHCHQISTNAWTQLLALKRSARPWATM